MVASRLNFFLIGAPKAGTTLIHARLSRHPQVFLSPLKEPNHFATDIDPARFSSAFRANVPGDLEGYLADRPLKPRQIGFVQNPEHYSALFEGADEAHRVVGECSSSYLWSTEAAANVAAAHRDARIVVVLRHPVERLHSHWLMARKYGFTRLPLLEAVEQDQAHPDPGWGRSELFVEAGLYADALGRWLRAFPEGQVKVLFNEELDDPATWLDLADWLGLDGAIPDVDRTEGNRAGRARWEGLNVWLTRTGLKPVLGALLPAGLKRKVRMAWYTEEGLDALSDGDRRRLMPLFESDIRSTSARIGRNLDHWLVP